MAKGPRKAYFGVLALAGVALVLDRVFSDGPRAARADAAPAEDFSIVPASRPAALPASADTAATRLAGVAARPSAAGDLGAVPDWLRPRDEPAPAVKAGPEKPWAKRHHVAGFTRGQRVGVSVDGKFLSVGKTLDGMTLVEVDADAGVAVFRGKGGEERLPLPVQRVENPSENPRDAGPDSK